MSGDGLSERHTISHCHGDRTKKSTRTCTGVLSWTRMLVHMRMSGVSLSLSPSLRVTVPPQPSSLPIACSSRAAMPLFAATTDLSCSICQSVHETSSDAFVLSCSDEGCKAMLCFDCMQKAVFASTGNRQKLCPHCRRPATSYSYAVFSMHKNLNALRHKVFAKEAEADRLKKRLASIKIDAELAVQRLEAWQAWAATSTAALLAMPRPESQQPPAAVSPRARSRSPRRDV